MVCPYPGIALSAGHDVEGPTPNGKAKWQYAFEWVIVPMTGLSLAVYGSLTDRISGAWIPVIVGLIAFPFARTLDKLRRDE